MSTLPDLEPAGMEAARRKGREIAGNQPGALVEAFAEVTAAGAAAYLAARSAPEAGKAVDATEILSIIKDWELWAGEWAGSAFVADEALPLDAMTDSEHKTELYSGLCKLMSSMMWLHDEVSALASVLAPSGAEPAPSGKWEIDNSTDSPILTYEKCSVIQDEQAYYVLKLVRADAATQAVPAEDVAEQPLSRMSADDGRPMWEQISDLIKFHMNERPPIRLRDKLVTILAWARYGEARLTTSESEATSLRRKLEEEQAMTALQKKMLDEAYAEIDAYRARTALEDKHG